ncbi:hypothetical protein BU23DRAFT_573428 [Bimuria novae-zelandiae CBS 107.79]|uniref:Uncharacterized protein n=1 Tax=Bimuria novae-zelandiae CBS 107.79 TaxID=1447943 RepID=A0A6A5UTT6_9PLEO|nr:hypothetical protein BU23DRAFT_573428 [Bimuria novae-zelandiae CBS 107.79]
MKVNDEAKVRRSTRAEVLGTAKVIGFDELEAKRTEREAMKEAKAKAKSKRGRKRKASLEAAEEDGREEGQQASSSSKVKRGRKRNNTTTLEDPTAEMVRRSEAQVEDISGRHTGEDNLTRQ